MVATKAAAKAASGRWADKQTAVLRGRGMGDAQIRAELTKAGYPAAAAKAATPSSKATSSRPASAPPAAPAAAPSTPASSQASATPRSLPAVDVGSGGVAGFLLGLVATAVLINFMHGGTAQVRRWGAAKFLNVVTGKPSAPGTPGAGPPLAGPMGTTPDPNFIPTAAALPGTGSWGAF